MTMSKIVEYSNLCHTINQRDNVVSFVGSLPDDGLLRLYYGDFEKAIKRVVSHDKQTLMRLAPVEGTVNLREILSHWFSGEIVVTNGSQQGLNVVFGATLKVGDTVLVEPFTYIGVEQIVCRCGAKPRSIPDMVQMMEVNEIEKIIRETAPTVMYVQTYFSNPTGVSIDNRRLMNLRTLARKYNFYLIEDQVYGWLDVDYPSVDNNNLVNNPWIIQLSSVSKIMAAGLRVGWVSIQDHNLFERVVYQKEVSDLSTSFLDQEIVFELLSQQERFYKWRKQVREIYSKRMAVLMQGLSGISDDFQWVVPSGGYYLWVKGPKEFDASKHLESALRFGVSFVPGTVFAFDSGDANNAFRLSVSSLTEKEIIIGVKRLVKLL